MPIVRAVLFVSRYRRVQTARTASSRGMGVNGVSAGTQVACNYLALYFVYSLKEGTVDTVVVGVCMVVWPGRTLLIYSLFEAVSYCRGKGELLQGKETPFAVIDLPVFLDGRTDFSFGDQS